MSPIHPFERMQAAVQTAEFDLLKHTPHGLVVPGFKPVEMKMGHKKAHKPVLDLREYIVNEVEPPAAVWRGMHLAWQMLLNNLLGDCGEAMAIHGDMAFHHDAGTPVPPWANIDAQNAYTLIGNYNANAPLVNGVNPTDQGTDNNVLVEKWMNPGIKCAANGFLSQIAGSVFVDPTDDNLCKLAIWEFVVRFTAAGLPLTAQKQSGQWSVVGDGKTGDSAIGSWGYHDFPEIGFDANRAAGVTWGMPWSIEWPFNTTYGVQSFAVVTKEQTNLSGVSPAGVDWTKLNADLAKLPAVQS